ANVHEKKVAIIEDGVVTEFYVERRDENQGVVGNLYKGRVMKVLPGMQSAFVDIALERDAFLYVSDFTEFMEEEEEIDFREVVEDVRVSPPRIDDRARRGDRPRPEPAAATGRPVTEQKPEIGPAERQLRIEDAVEQLAEIAVERVIPPPPTEEEISAEAEARTVEAFPIERVTDDEPERPAEHTLDQAEGLLESDAEEPEQKPKRGRARKTPEPRKRAAKTEEKPARTPARKAAPKTAAKRTRRRGEDEGPAESDPVLQFQRVTDEDMRQEETGELLKDAIVQEKIIEQVHTAEFDTGGFQPEPEPEWRVGSLRSLAEVDSAFQRVVDESAEAAAREQTPRQNVEVGQLGGEQLEESKLSPFRHISDVARGLYGRIRSGTSTEPGETSEESYSRESEDNSRMSEAVTANDDDAKREPAVEEDRDAEVRDRGHRAEFAVRRGGRGRRGRGGRREVPPSADGAAPAENGTALPASAGGIEVKEEPQRQEETVHAIEDQPAEARPAEARPAEARPAEARPAEARPIDTRQADARPSGPRPQRRPDPRRPDPRRPDQRRPDTRRPDPRGPDPRRIDAGPARRPDRVGPPTISDLLHEGQEILVQIAKEPIAKKGARITSHIALPGRFIVYMPTVNHIGVSRKIPNEVERIRLKRIVTALRDREGASGGFIARTACAGHTEQELADDMRYLLRTWGDVRKKAERVKAPSMVHRDLDLVQRILRDQLADDFVAIRIDNEVEYARIVEFVNRIQPKLVKRVKLYTASQPILEKYGVQAEIDKAVRPRVWLKSGGYIVINQTEALVAIDVNTGKFVGKSDKLEDTITRTNLEAAKEIVRQVRLRDLGGIIVIDFIDMEERKNRQKVMMALQQELSHDRAPSKILSINDFGLVAITRKRVKQSLERTLCTPCPYCQGAGMVKSAQTMCFEILEQAKAMTKQLAGSSDVMLRVSPHVAEAMRTSEREVMEEIEAYFGTPVTIEPDPNLHQEQYDFAVM
ncbi:MAG: Rne/Rng family ribonuclease, partial [Blastocatellia bacterium]